MDDEYAEIYYADLNRNGRDHRPTTGATPTAGPRPLPARAIVMRPMQAVAGSPVMYGPAPQGASGLLGNLTTGQIVDIAAQLFAALQGLPAAPVATKDVSTDVGNLVLYQSALAAHAKRDEQLRTLGALIAKLVS